MSYFNYNDSEVTEPIPLSNISVNSSTIALGYSIAYPETEKGPDFPVNKTVLGIILSILIFVSIAGNLLVCLAIYTNRRLRKLGNLFLVSLSLADLFVASLVETFALVNDLKSRWIFGAQFCDTWIAFDVMCSTASILNLCAISLDRFIHIKDPLRYRKWMSRRVILGSVAAIWLVSGIVSFLPISLGWHKPNKRTLLDEQQCALDLTPTYAIVSSCISFYLPCIVMVALYTRLYLYARKHVKKIRSVTKPSFINGSSRTNIRSHQSMDHKAAITLGIIMGSFLVCWVPFFCVNIIAAFCKTCVSELTFKCLTWLGYLNSALNPVIYSIFNTEFRNAFQKILNSYVHGHCYKADPDFRNECSEISEWRMSQRRRSGRRSSSELITLRPSAPSESSEVKTAS